ncbi:3'-Phosphoadenosine 5'-phosphosulfate (PAPS) 3'-phosphatase [Desulfacinum infernum DSM 9756]|uniref:3'-Phosphoadenosine 5'-phosphosulfate (PAPS) 3'-phosphatase n=1 Tax=Desulfacinum infernum DSM 9756 TaxID=1121391 RepID=A0A1M5HXF8_9BACT|nr:sulfotransferase [Desulfacinum infernum]SHG20543.1 3'-Phosphoadenosine 5'-phosphosulfate (PAPS) 3'-phosphatase [Desulfacinum infernum DSM 9756]
METQQPKIFGIGLSKTGTTSLANALAILGYRVKDNPGLRHYTPGSLPDELITVVDAHDAVTDTPIPSFFRQLDERYPGSKFILTVRDRTAWLRSCRKQFTQAHAEKQSEAHRRLFMDLYGCVTFDEDKFSSGYERHLNRVLEYFSDRPEDLLILDITGGEGWEKLCPFLGRSIPDQPFPKANVTRISWLPMDAIADIVQEAAESLSPALPWPWRRLRGAPLNPTRVAKIFLASAVRILNPLGPDLVCSYLHRLISRRLESVDPSIPIVSPLSPVPAWEQRKRWNHLWYVDTGIRVLPGAKASPAGRISVALIQDGQPLMGAVYDFHKDTLICGRIGKGAFVQDATEGRRNLQSFGESAPTAVVACLGKHLGTGSEDPIVRAGTMEWETAPVHAILRALGMELQEAATGRTLRYNKRSLVNPAVRIATSP